MSETSHKYCAHIFGNPRQAQAAIDDATMCAPCCADWLEKNATRSPGEIADRISFDRCKHNGDLPCNLCRVGTASAITLLWSYSRLNGDGKTARELSRLLKRLRVKHGNLFHLGQHSHEQFEQD